jgi:hypothetical protein
MTDDSSHVKAPGLNSLRFDRRLLTSAEILAGTGAVLWVAGWAVGIAALRRAAQDWAEQLDEAPSELVIGKWRQLLHATTAATKAYTSGPPNGS